MPLPVLSPVLLLLAPIPQTAPAPPVASTKPPVVVAHVNAPAPRTPLRFDLQITRIDTTTTTAPASGTTSAATASNTPSPAGADTPPQPPAPPVILATPVLNMMDAGTATIAVTNPEFGYTIALSPTIENTEKSINGASVLTLWNLRFSGHSLPGGTSNVTLTGSTRLPSSGTDSIVLAEVLVRDPKTGQMATFRLSAHVTVDPPPVVAH